MCYNLQKTLSGSTCFGTNRRELDEDDKEFDTQIVS